MAEKKRIRVLMVAASLLFALLLGELFLQFFAQDSYHVWQPNKVVIFKPAPGVMPGVEGRSRFITNDKGIRGEPIPPGDAWRILAMGGSTTECLFLDQLEAWPQRLQERLDGNTPSGRSVWVGNVGKSGHTTQNHVIQIEKLLAQHPEMDVVLLLVGINDFIIRLARGKAYQPEPPVEQLRPDRYESLMDRSFAVWPGADRHLPILKRTEIYRRWRRFRRRHVSPPSSAIVQDRAGQFYQRFRSHRRRASAIRETLPDLSSALDKFERNLVRIIDCARVAGLRLVFLTQPCLWHPDLSEEERALLWAGGVGVRHQFEPGHPYYSPAALAEGMDRFNRRLMRVCARQKVEVLDLHHQIPKSSDFFYDDMHFNEKGSSLVAARIADYLLPSL